MFAINPNTKKPIRILTTETVLSKTNRTLVWHSPTFQGNHEKWQRISVIVTDVKSLKHISEPDLVFIPSNLSTDETEIWTKWLKNSTNKTLIITDVDTLMKIGYDNKMQKSILVTNEFESRYTHLEKLELTAPTELWVLKIAQLLRFHKLISHKNIDNFSKHPYSGTIKVIEPTSTPDSVLPPIYLIQQYFVPENTKRAKEIRTTLNQNIACQQIDKIILLNEKIYDLPNSDKIMQVVINKRMLYQDVFNYAKENLPAESFVVFSNSDIYLDSTINNLYNMDMDKKFLSLLRYDTNSKGQPPKLFGPRPDSQDTWIFKTGSLDFVANAEDFGFSFGIPGCDNAINIAMFRKRFIVANPALTIRTYHNQESEIRTYNRTDIIDKPMFLYLTPTALQEYNPLKDFDTFLYKPWSKCPYVPVIRNISCVDKENVKPLLDTLKKTPEFNYVLDSDNVYNYTALPTENKLYYFDSPKFIMPSGVINDTTNLFMGANEIWEETWKKVKTSVLEPTLYVSEMCAINYPENLTINEWFTNYFPNVLDIINQTKCKPAFLIHPSNEASILYQLLNIPEKHTLPVIKYTTECQYYAEKVYLLSPSKSKLPSQENISLLRKCLPKLKSNNKLAVLLGTSKSEYEMINKIKLNNYETVILTESCTFEKRFLSLMKADIVIGSSNSDMMNYIWLMKSGSTVIELIGQSLPNGTHIHLAGASNLKFFLLNYDAIDKIDSIVNISSEKTTQLTAAKPIVTVPTKQGMPGIYDHSGDTFREMVDIWESRNYITVIRSNDSPHVWWGKIGDTLLYDRPTMRWLQNVSYKQALFGNSMPENPKSNEKPWSFWPRSPKQVELIGEKPALTWNERTISSIFVGKIENGVQLANRTKADWSKVIDFFHMPIDSTGGPYKYSQSEYLDLISNSRYGLCLPGYGPKCNRDIEYFAAGTVPIIVPGVDMTNYVNPPLENVHYFSVNAPEEIPELVKNTSQEKWAAMSAKCRLWWQENASAEGLYNLTAKIINT